MPFVVPPPFRAAIDEIANLPADQWESLLSALSKEPAANLGKLVASAASATSRPPEEIGRLVTLLLNSMLAYQEGDDAADDLAAAVANQAPSWEQQNAAWRSALVSRFQETFEAEATFGVAAKSATVVSDSPNSFCDARILTDIRPIFTRNLDAKGFAVLHFLRVSAHSDDGAVRENFFSLSSEDLATLRTTIDRAQKKEEALRSQLELAWMS